MIQRRLLGLFFVLQIFTRLHASDVTINVDATQVHQTWYGFGCTPESGILGTDTLTASQRAQYVDMLFNQVRVKTCQVPSGFEAPAASPNPFTDQANDDSDPLNINWNGFNTQSLTQYKANVADLAPASATGDLYADARISTRWGAKWLTTIQTSNYNTFLDECAEQVLAQLTLFKNAYGREPLYAELFNEPTSGNGELINGTDTMITDIIIRCGDRLRANGFNTVKFVVPAQETEDKSLSTAQAIFANASAAKYVGAIAYHTYPYGSKYSYIPNILSGPGTGNPDPTRIAVRNKLRDLGKANGVPVWMTEVSNGFYGDNTASNMTSFNGLRGRAIHIHDEMLYAEISSFYGMNGLWSMIAQQDHFGNGSIGGNPDDLIFVDQPNNNVFITCTGRAIGHYARFINKGAKILTATSTHALVQVTTANDVATNSLASVIINNDSVAHAIALNVTGLALAGTVSGEQSTSSAYWQPVASFATAGASSYTVTVPALSVTSLAAPLAAAANQAPVVSAGTNQSVTIPAAATLNGSASDDGLPSGTLTLTWSKITGPGTVSFGTPGAAVTTATFLVPGTYVLQLSAFDGSLTSSATTTVTVSAPVGMPSGKLVRFTNDDPFLPVNPIGTPTPSEVRDVKLVSGVYQFGHSVNFNGVSNSASFMRSTSTDGLVWTSGPVLLNPTLPWENNIWGGQTLLDNGVYKIWYAARSAGWPNFGRSGYATSPDGISWTKNPNPILTPGPSGSWDDSRAFSEQVFKIGSTYRMYYQGSSAATGWAMGIATSSDGVNWTKSPGNPVTRPGAFGDVIQDPSTGLWYTWYNNGNGTSSQPITGINFSWSVDGLTWNDGPNNPVLTVNTNQNAYDSAGLNGGLKAYRYGKVYRVFYTATKAFDPSLGFWPEYVNLSQVNADGTPTQAPAVATPASVVSQSGMTANLSMLGSDAGGEANLTYTWAVFRKPSAAADPVFSINRSNAAKNVVATFSKAGTYRLRAIVTNPNDVSIASDVTVNVGTFDQVPPTVASGPSATPNPTGGLTTSVSILGADNNGEAGLKYYWVETYSAPARVVFSDTGTNSAKNCVATFSKAGSYDLQCYIVDGGDLDVLSNTVTVVVNQTLTSIVVAPASATVAAGGTQQFTAQGYDQFGAPMTTTPAIAWTATGGSVNPAGLFTAGATAGSFTVTARNGSVSGQASVTVTGGTAAPVITSALSATGTIGAAFSYTITASNTPVSFNATGLPAGLLVNTSSGVISGTPTAAGFFSVTLSASNAGGTGTATLSLTVLTSGPIAYWRFDENSGTTAADATGNGHTGTLVNSPAWVAGVVNSALKFTPSSNNYVAVADFNPPVALTLEAWINPGSNTGSDSIILDKHNLEYDFRVNGAGNLSASAGGTALTDTAFNFFSATNANQWYHVVYTFDNVAQSHALYRNGVRVALGSNTAAITNQSTQLWIGRHSQFNFGTFMGSIDEVRIYGRALSASEVLADYNAQKPAPPVPVITSGPSATPNPALIGQSVALTASASDADGDALTYSWAFGDGSTAIGSSVTHSYSAAGTFTATVTVSDGNGSTVTGSTVVTINNPSVFSLTTATAGTGAGSVTLNPPGGSYAAGTLVTLTVTPATDSTFAGWSGGASGASNPLTITVNANISVTATFNLTGLIAWWKFDEGTGTTANDSSGNGHTGTLVNAPTWVAGVKNTALNFVPSSNSYVAVANFSPPAALTLEAWIYPGNNAGVDSIILNKHNLEYDFRINGLGQLSGGAGGTYLTDSAFNFYSAANVNQWYHVVYTFDNVAHTHTLYRNGVQVATGSNNAALAGQSTQLWIGRHSQYNFGTFRGSIDEVRLFQRALSAAEVLADYNAINSSGTLLASASAAATAPGSGNLNVAKLQANVKFNVANADACSISGTIQILPSDFKPAGQTVILDLGGAVYSFVLNSKAQSKSLQGSFALKISKSHKAAPTGTMFTAKLAKCSLAGVWGLDPASSHAKASIDTYMSIDLGGNAYDTLVTLLYTSKANAGAKVKK